MQLIKKYIPLAIVTVVGLLTLATYYVPAGVSSSYLETMNQWETIVTGFSMILGTVSLFIVHGRKVVTFKPGWGYSLTVFIGFFAVFIPGLLSSGLQATPSGQLTSLGWAFRYIYNPLSATMFAVLAFYIVSTAFRSFRIKSPQAFLLFVAAFILIMANVPLGELIWNRVIGWTGCTIDIIKNWIVAVPSVAAKRGIMVGITIGAVVTSLKIIFGIERSYMGRD